MYVEPISKYHKRVPNLLQEVTRGKIEMEQMAKAKLLKKQLERNKLIHDYLSLLDRKPDKKVRTFTDMKVAIKALKMESDGRMPSVKPELINMYDKIKSHHDNVVLEFNEEIPGCLARPLPVTPNDCSMVC